MKAKITIEGKNYEKRYKRIFFISDIHNHLKSYKEMRDKLAWGPGDLVIIVGDIVDRGGNDPDPLGMLKEVRFEQNREYEVIMLRGNHEQWLAEAIFHYLDYDIEGYFYNSLQILTETLTLRELNAYADWMIHLPLGMEMTVSGYRKPFKIAHASTSNMEDMKDTLIGIDWTGSPLFLEALKDKRFIHVVGHMVTSNVRQYLDDSKEDEEKQNTDILRIRNRLWCIDCGNGYRDYAGFPGKLGCVELSGHGKVTEHYV